MKLIIVNKNEAGQRIDKFLLKYLNAASAGFIYKMLRKKNITLNGKKSDGREKLVAGDEIKLFMSEDTINKFSRHDIDINTMVLTNLVSGGKNPEVIYEDENIIFMNKPQGILSQKSKPEDISINEIMIAHLIKNGSFSISGSKGFKPSICNRLDRNTSGLIAGGKSLCGLQELSRMFKEHTMDKYYVCIVDGKLTNSCTIEGYLTKDENSNKVTISHDNTKGSFYIKTLYYPITSNDRCTLLAVKLVTGRTHQIRAHLSSISHPIIGDIKYGYKSINDYFKEKYGINTQMLHSYCIKFSKIEGRLSYLSNMSFTAPVPDEFMKVIDSEFEDL